jgi:ubiquinone/menaquinone biosynthesis C-methylase UbiE
MEKSKKIKRWWLDTWLHRWHMRLYVPHFLSASPEPMRGEVLEIGAGRGWTSRLILNTYPQVELTATDIDPAAMRTFTNLQGKYGQRLKVREASALELPFDRESFDFVLAINVMPELDLLETTQALAQMLRVLRQGGLLGISEHRLVRRAREHSKVEQILRTERCEVLVTQGERTYDIWARKPYQT